LPIKVPSVFYSEREEKDKTIDGDGDGDGLMDSVEEYPILTSYGFFVNTDKEEPDTDFDGKLDGEELVSDGPVYVKRVIGYYNDQGLYVKSDKYDEFVEEYGSEITSDLACWIMTSRPDEPDSDFDFLDDSKDSEPMVSQFKTVILGGKPYYYGLDENGDAEKIPYDISKPEYDGYIIVQDGEPVILCKAGLETYEFDFSTEELKMNVSETLKFYIFHYVTITGLMELNGERYLKIQTWGEVRYLKFNEIFQ